MAGKENPQEQPDKWQQMLPEWKKEIRERKIIDFQIEAWKKVKKAITVFKRKK